MALDAEDGPITDTARLAWTSSIDGGLGTGAELLLAELSKGTHAITLTATDSDGHTGTAEISVFAGLLPNETYLPLILRDGAP